MEYLKSHNRFLLRRNTVFNNATVFIVGFMIITVSGGCKHKSQDRKPEERPSNSPPSLPCDEFQIQPGIGVGELRFGMTREEMENVLGKPERSHGKACEYLAKGLATIGSKSTDVAVLMFGDGCSNPDSPLVEACKYKTSKGIGMKSTKVEIFEAYGQPSRIDNPTKDIQIIEYKSIGAQFSLRNGKVVHMIFRPLDK